MPPFVIDSLEPRLFLSAGQLDPTFGDHGKLVLTPELGFNDWLDMAVVQSDGKLLTISQVWRNAFEIRRYTARHRLDSSFGQKGVVHGIFYNGGYYRGENRGIAVQPDGKILHLYHQSSVTGDVFATRLERRLPNGRLDRSFGTRGTVTLHQGRYGQVHDLSACFLLQPDGTILIGGPADNNQIARVILKRLGPNGSPDSSFGQNGVANIDMPSQTYATASKLLRQPDGKILWIGSDRQYGLRGQVDYSASVVILARFNPDGSPDTTFGQAGLAITPIRPDKKTGASISDAILQPDGKIALSAIAYNAYGFTMQFNPDGTLDQGYGENGRSIILRDTKPDDLNSSTTVDLATQSDSRLVFAMAGKQILVGRLMATGQFDPTFGRRGITRTSFGGNARVDDRPTTLITEPDDDILLVGQRDPISYTSAIVLARYQAT